MGVHREERLCEDSDDFQAKEKWFSSQVSGKNNSANI